MKSARHQKAGRARYALLSPEQKQDQIKKMLEGQRKWREKIRRLSEAAREVSQ